MWHIAVRINGEIEWNHFGTQHSAPTHPGIYRISPPLRLWPTCLRTSVELFYLSSLFYSIFFYHDRLQPWFGSQSCIGHTVAESGWLQHSKCMDKRLTCGKSPAWQVGGMAMAKRWSESAATFLIQSLWRVGLRWVIDQNSNCKRGPIQLWSSISPKLSSASACKWLSMRGIRGRYTKCLYTGDPMHSKPQRTLCLSINSNRALPHTWTAPCQICSANLRLILHFQCCHIVI